VVHAPPVGDAVALLEFESVAGGLRALDALVKKAPVTVLEANLVEPGRFLVMFCGGVAEVDESYREAVAVGEGQVVDQMFLPHVHPILVAALRGQDDVRTADELDTLGVVEGQRVASTLEACDRALKDAGVALTGVRVAGGLGGRAYFLVHGAQHDVQAALDIAGIVLDDAGHRHRIECIPRPHAEMVAWLLRPAPFSLRSSAPEV
jgi:microcompartment protein CcmL/EutN